MRAGHRFRVIHMRDRRGPEGLELHQIFCEEKIKSPVQSDAKLLFKARKLAQINRSPHPPGYESREIDTQDICHSSTPPNCRQLTDGRKRERFKIPAANSRDEILRHCFSLAQGVLSGRGMVLPGLRVRYQCAIT